MVEAIGSLQFVPRTGSISKDGSLRIEPHDPNARPELEMISIREQRRDDDIGGSDDIQMVNR